jgi:hypothetical protein
MPSPQYEDEFLRREREREARRGQERTARPDPPDAPANVQGLIGQSREPLFVSSAYFLRFRFEPGRYALVGRETFDGREVLRVEYYPTHLFSDRDNRREQPRAPVAGGQPDERRREEMRRVMNKVSLVTLWVDPERHQIVRYTFENVGLDFLPTSWTWLLRIADVRATMEMGEAFPDVWLPERIDISGPSRRAGPVRPHTAWRLTTARRMSSTVGPEAGDVRPTYAAATAAVLTGATALSGRSRQVRVHGNTVT